MSSKFEMVKQYLSEIGLPIVSEDAPEELVIVEDQENGIANLIIDCEEPIIILEQLIMEVPSQPGDMFKRLLQINRELVHGAFVLDADAKYLFFRDTLQLENLDRNELEGSIRALELAMAEYGSELLEFASR